MATYRALRAQHTPVKMIWQSWGHSQSTPAPGELSLANPNPRTQYETQRVAAWFDHYLKGHTAPSTGPQFSYFRDWVHYKGIATPAYEHIDHFPVGTLRTFYLSGNKTLRTSSTARRHHGAAVRDPAGRRTDLAEPASTWSAATAARAARDRLTGELGDLGRPEAEPRDGRRGLAAADAEGRLADGRRHAVQRPGRSAGAVRQGEGRRRRRLRRT